jgi:hypothetical protein
VSVASATCYTQDLNVRSGGTKARNGAQSFNLVHVYENTVLHSVVPVGTYSEVSYVSAEESAAILEREGITVLPAASAAILEDTQLTVPVEIIREATVLAAH